MAHASGHMGGGGLRKPLARHSVGRTIVYQYGSVFWSLTCVVLYSEERQLVKGWRMLLCFSSWPRSMTLSHPQAILQREDHFRGLGEEIEAILPFQCLHLVLEYAVMLTQAIP